MNSFKEIIIEWEELSLNDLDHYPEKFVYSFIEKESKSVNYIGSAYLESPKAEIPKMLRRHGLKSQNIRVIFGYLSTDAVQNNILSDDLNELIRFLHCKYQPLLNKTVSISEINNNTLKIKGDNLMSVFRVVTAN